MPYRVILLFCLICSTTLFSNSGDAQRRIKTMQDFVEIENTLKMTQRIEPQKSNYYLGLLYFSEHKFKNGKVIHPDYSKAFSYFEKSLNAGNMLAAFNMAMIFLKRGEVDNSIFVLDMALDALSEKNESDVSTGAYLSSALASIVLDFKATDKESIRLASEHLALYVTVKDMPSANYLLSQLYLRLGNINMANKELSIACSSYKKPMALQAICKASRRHQK